MKVKNLNLCSQKVFTEEKQLRSHTWKTKNVSDESEEKSRL